MYPLPPEVKTTRKWERQGVMSELEQIIADRKAADKLEIHNLIEQAKKRFAYKPKGTA